MEFVSENFSTVYKQILQKLYSEPEYVTQPRDSKIHELLNQSLTIKNPQSCLYKNQIRSSKYKYIAKELLYYFSGRNDVDWIGDAASFWHKIANDDGTINSAYGYLIFQEKNEHGYTPYNWALECLKQDKDSRQVIVHFNKPKHQYDGNRDQICTMYGIFHIRNNRLHFKINMRSNDVITGLPTDIAFFVTLQQQMLTHLREIYPSLELGTYTHTAESLHLYESDFEKVGKMLEYQFVPDYLPEIDINSSLVNKSGEPTFNLEEANLAKIVRYKGNWNATNQTEIDISSTTEINCLWNWIIDQIKK